LAEVPIGADRDPGLNEFCVSYQRVVARLPHAKFGEATMPVAARPASIVQRLLPVLGWLPGYRRDWLLPDVLAGLAVWAVKVPEGMAYAGIVGVSPIMGLYTLVLPLVARLCPARYLAPRWLAQTPRPA
jgi:Sulfate permease family